MANRYLCKATKTDGDVVNVVDFGEDNTGSKLATRAIRRAIDATPKNGTLDGQGQKLRAKKCSGQVIVGSHRRSAASMPNTLLQR